MKIQEQLNWRLVPERKGISDPNRRRPGRPKQEDSYNCPATTAFTESQLAYIDSLAIERGWSRAQTIRLLVEKGLAVLEEENNQDE